MIIPQGLAGKDVLNVTCDAGGYSFLAHQLGARNVTGFDVRQHWLQQAMLIKSIKFPDVETINFAQNNTQQFFDNGIKVCDVVISEGIFYHHADPIRVLMLFCDAARESILVDSASADEIPEQCLAPISESRTHVMSGIEALALGAGRPQGG